MAAVRPLVWYHDTGRMEELRVGDTLTGASGSSDAFAFFLGS